MWRGPFALACSGALALGANVCGGLPTRPAEGSNLFGTPGASSFRLSVQRGGPAFRITIRHQLLRYSDTAVPAGDIEVDACQDGKTLQRLAIVANQPIDFGATFDASDVNFDGYLDFSVLAAFGGKWGSHAWWVYDPAAGKFVQNELTRELAELRTNGYHIDTEKHEIAVEFLLAGCPSLVTRYRVEDNRLIKIHEETGKQVIERGSVPRPVPAGVPCTVTFSDLAGGTLRVTKVRHFVEGAPVK